MLFFGLLSFLSIHDSLKKIIDLSESELVAVVKCIDSSNLKEDMENILNFHKITYHIFHDNICLDHENLLKALFEKVFTDFDELWLFKGSFPTQNISTSRCTSDFHNFNKRLPNEVVDVFLRTDCWMLLGDGCGLNYLTADERIEILLKR